MEVIKMHCEECTRELTLGVNALAAQEGVIGPNGFVDLEDPIYFCAEECLREYFNDVEKPSLPRRIP